METRRSFDRAGKVALAAALITGSVSGCSDRAPTALASTPTGGAARSAAERQALASAVDDARDRVGPSLTEGLGDALNGALTRLSAAVRAADPIAMRGGTAEAERALSRAPADGEAGPDIEAIRLVLEQVREAAR
jgi:hypothetical protein